MATTRYPWKPLQIHNIITTATQSCNWSIDIPQIRNITSAVIDKYNYYKAVMTTREASRVNRTKPRASMVNTQKLNMANSTDKIKRQYTNIIMLISNCMDSTQPLH